MHDFAFPPNPVIEDTGNISAKLTGLVWLTLFIQLASKSNEGKTEKAKVTLMFVEVPVLPVNSEGVDSLLMTSYAEVETRK